MKVTIIKEYLDSLDENGVNAVNNFINFMSTDFSVIVPVISYSMPMWKLGKKMYNGYIAVSALKEHFSVHLHDEVRIKELSAMVPDCNFGKRCVNIKYGDEKALTVVKK
ncbi:MAG: DUF1801 domain-containing protein, partial [Oscillospiraceae bacterium]|nr:DUF1801 domain-containing protein [Oscillospiraceae bacterium]